MDFGKICSTGNTQLLLVPGNVPVMSTSPKVSCSWPTSKTDGFVARSVEIWELFLKDEISLYWMKPSCFFR